MKIKTKVGLLHGDLICVVRRVSYWIDNTFVFKPTFEAQSFQYYLNFALLSVSFETLRSTLCFKLRYVPLTMIVGQHVATVIFFVCDGSNSHERTIHFPFHPFV
jgi:hypothetical protein